MRTFSDCQKRCCICCREKLGCLAEFGVDDYAPAIKEQLIDRLDRGEYPDCTYIMIEALKDWYNYDYIIRERE